MILSKITKLQQQLIILFYSFRYLTSTQLTKYLGHKSKRQAQRHLETLRKTKYVRLIKEETSSKNLVLAGYSSYPASIAPIYTLGSSGIRLIRQLKDLTHEQVKNRYKDPTRSQTLIDHRLLLTEIFLQLKYEAKVQNINLTFQTKEDYEEGSVFEMLHPDAYVVKIKETKGRKERDRENKQYFFEIIDPNTPSRIFRRRVRSYVKYFLQNSIEVETGQDYPTVLFICPNEAVKGKILNYAAAYIANHGAEDMILKATNKKQALVQSVTSDIWIRAVLEEE